MPGGERSAHVAAGRAEPATMAQRLLFIARRKPRQSRAST
jgi:hypothetical protein